MRLRRQVDQRIVRPSAAPDCSLTARSWSGGYSTVKSPCPIELPTCTIEWQDVQRQAGLRFRRVDLLLDRPVEAAVEEHRVVVAAGAPFRRLRADGVLHVLDRLAVPLVVERRKVVRRRVPLVVDVLVAAAARCAGHEEVRRDGAADVGVGRRGKERDSAARRLPRSWSRAAPKDSQCDTAPADSVRRPASPLQPEVRRRRPRLRGRPPPCSAVIGKPTTRREAGPRRRPTGCARSRPLDAPASRPCRQSSRRTRPRPPARRQRPSIETWKRCCSSEPRGPRTGRRQSQSPVQ